MSVFADTESKQLLDLQYMHDVDVAMNRRGHPWAFTLSASCLVFFAVFFLWANNAMIDDVTRGQGQITPAQGTQPIQSERGGTITDILVSENEQVERNQPVLTISNVQAVAGLNDLKTRYIELTLSLKRLAAEEAGVDPAFTDEEKESYPEAVNAQMRIFATRKEQLEGQSSMLQSQIEQRKREVAEARERKESYEGALAVLMEEEKTVRPLVGRSYSQIQYLQLRQRIVAQEGELNSVAQTIARVESGVNAAEQRLQSLKAERQAGIADEINKTRNEQANVEQLIKSGDEQVTRTELRSPVRGKVVRILLKKDGVAKPAETIMEIIPTDGALEVEAKFSPQDRGFLFVNQPAMVKVSAYEFSIYGGLEATVTKISNDTIEDKKGQPWYEVRFLTKRNSILYRGEELPILPGMTVTVDVLTDKKSVLSHIVGPLRRAMQNAMTEH
ncbi:MAG: HlyD family secretion protein [Desulfovibrio sp.]|jgi:adhesin transport system membrane fusion protein|nr:HlyD family secretion protein [Desulfovibrio sp.]